MVMISFLGRKRGVYNMEEQVSKDSAKARITKEKRIEDMKQSANRNRQNATYKEGKPVPDNNVFFEERSNSLCSKGN